MAAVRIVVPSYLCGSPSDAWLFSTGMAVCSYLLPPIFCLLMFGFLELSSQRIGGKICAGSVISNDEHLKSGVPETFLNKSQIVVRKCRKIASILLHAD